MANQAASSSSSIINSHTHDVFLSFRGEDTRKNFTDHLYNALRQKGINTFIDEGLRRGNKISEFLLRAIEESRISIIVFSENYAESKWCLDELEKILECKKSKQQMVRPIFYKVDPSDVRNQRGSYGKALAQHERKFKDDIEKVSRWKEALSEAANLSGWPFLDGHESQFIHKIVKEISGEMLHQTCLDVATYPIGLESCVQDVEKLLDVGRDGVRMVGIWGTGGIGKTTIAKAVYNSIAYKFDGSCFLADVRENSMACGGVVKLQESLLADILREEGLKVTSVDRGVGLIKMRLRNIKVLLILDDVDQLEQLNKLARVSDWFGSGSRIIITTRDAHLLTAHQVHFVYEVKVLDDQKAIELFSWNAFKTSQPPNDYEELARRAVHYVQGLPLALIVLGSHLYGRSADQWQETMDSDERVSDKRIHEILKISFCGLEDLVKEVFLDIACFFKGYDVAYVMEVLQCCDLRPKNGIEQLVHKALITIDGTRILMHDLLEEMGKEIVRKESPDEPGKRSRLWFYKDVYRVLTENTGTNTIKGIMVKVPEPYNQICLNAESFSKMKNLKFFVNYGAHFSGDFDYLSNELRWLDWPGCPLRSLPSNFHPMKLRALMMPRSFITRLWEGFKAFPNLTHLNFEGCGFLEKIPDVTRIPNLMHLDLSYCTSLVEVHPSVGFLDKLVVLRLRGCSNLVIFPRRISLKSLEVIDLSDCSRLAYFPEIVGKMESLRYMNLQGSAIRNLPLLQHRQIDNTNAGHHQEASVLMKHDDTNVHQEQAYPQKRKTFEEPMHESQFIHKIVEEISVEVLHQTCLHVATYPVGLMSGVREVVELLGVGGDGVIMGGILGMGGIGKTTIAKAVYNSIASKFDGSCFLADVIENSRPRGGVVQLQETLLADILRVKGLKVTSVDRGVELIKKRLGNKKVLLVLDDVYNLEVLKKLAGGSGWFGSGSRIIITTRYERLLVENDVRFIYRVELLDEQKALELFSWNAFKTSQPPNGYEKLTRRVVDSAQGHALALIVLGSHLCGRSADQWQATIDYCHSASDYIIEILKISIDGLEDHVRNVFLDIACFFKGKDLAYVTGSLQCCDRNPTACIELLVEKALIAIEGTRILMHDLLEEVGKEIVRLEGVYYPGGRSRLWHREDVYDVLTENSASPRLTHLYIEGCELLEKIPDVTSMPNLKHLDLSYCTSLVEVHPSVGFLDKLVVLRLRGCSNLVIFPRRISLKSLEVIDLRDCARLAYFPEIVGKMESLRYMNLQGSAIRNLPLLQHREIDNTNAGHHQEANASSGQPSTSNSPMIKL